jgi:4-hydroxybenzoate polyprenyltransferase
MKKLIDAFIFSSLFIVLCAVAMVVQSYQLLPLGKINYWYLLFTAGGTMASYNVHWFFTDVSLKEDYSIRHGWTYRHQYLLLPFAGFGMLAALIAFYFLLQHWLWIAVGCGLAFLYTAPKIPGKMGLMLRKIAIGKTIYLSLAWTYITAILPVLVSNAGFNTATILFILQRYFFIYALCILFDYRDREEDIQQGIRSLITIFNTKAVTVLLYVTVLASILTGSLYAVQVQHPVTGILLSVPVVIVLFLYPIAQKSRNDYLYYVLVDGLMIVSYLFTAFQQR